MFNTERKVELFTHMHTENNTIQVVDHTEGGRKKHRYRVKVFRMSSFRPQIQHHVSQASTPFFTVRTGDYTQNYAGLYSGSFISTPVSSSSPGCPCRAVPNTCTTYFCLYSGYIEHIYQAGQDRKPIMWASSKYSLKGQS